MSPSRHRARPAARRRAGTQAGGPRGAALPGPQVRLPPHPSAWKLLRRAWDDFNADNGSLMAAAISFYALLSLVPMLLVAISVVGYFLGSSARGEAQVFDFVRRFLLPSASESLRDVVDQVIQARGLIGGFGLLSLIWTSMQGMLTLETAVNAIWNRPPRHYVGGRLFALTSLLALGLLFGLTMGITSFQVTLSRREGFGWLSNDWSVAILGWLGAVLVSTTMFATIFGTFPTRRVSARYALRVGFGAAGAWEVAKQGYVWYVSHLANFGSVYGPLGSLIGLITWIYASGFLILLGSELVHLLTEPPATDPGGKSGG